MYLLIVVISAQVVVLFSRFQDDKIASANEVKCVARGNSELVELFYPGRVSSAMRRYVDDGVGARIRFIPTLYRNVYH
ncbi:hypothetical protein TcasGA2_TC005223 [Tribolium castaneum]|uniref:Uncharacterized protein n=1 Tax=Tribolium castaneum TaxID=7070 RepID=D6X1J7_TRICA|nr:hypothetical protein TcasGA2_TC005223 [Tribolium castaneum]